MTTILTVEQVEAIKRIWPESVACPWDEVLDSHEMLQTQLAEARLAFADMSTEREMGEIYIADLKADVRALAVLLTDVNVGLVVFDCNHCKDRINEALGRPGVQRLLAKEEA